MNISSGRYPLRVVGENTNNGVKKESTLRPILIRCRLLVKTPETAKTGLRKGQT
jgi:hypothetical protein